MHLHDKTTLSNGFGLLNSIGVLDLQSGHMTLHSRTVMFVFHALF